MLMAFDLEALNTMDGGRIRELINQKLKTVLADCKDRPALTAARKLVVTIALSPECNDEATDMRSCDVQVEVKVALPRNKTGVYSMKAVRGGLVFNEDSLDNVHQTTLGLSGGATKDDVDGKRKAANDAP